MNKTLKVIVFLFGFLFCSSKLLFAQIDADTDYQKILAVFSSGKTYSVEMIVSYFFPPDSISPFDTTVLHYCGNGKDFFYSLKGFEMINCEGMHLEIDLENKVIAVQDSQPNLPKWSQQQFFDMIANLGGSQPKVSQIGKDLRKIEFEFPNTTTPNVSLIYNDKNFSIKECSLLYAQKTDPWSNKVLEYARIKIEYRNLVFLKSFPSEKYSIKKYIVKKDNQYFPSPSYSGYEILQPRGLQ